MTEMEESRRGSSEKGAHRYRRDKARDYVRTHVYRRLVSLEHERRRKLSLIRIGVGIGLVTLGVTVLAGFLFDLSKTEINDILIAASIATIIGYPLQEAADYTKKYKSLILPKLVEALGPLRYTPKGTIDEGQIEPSLILPEYFTCTSEFHVSGKYRGVPLQASEVLLMRKTGFFKTEEKIAFQGLFVLFGLPEGFRKRTIVLPDLTGPGNLIRDMTLKLAHARLEDPLFEKRFEVYTEDQVEARRIFTPAFMERFTALSDLFNRARLKASFYNRRVFIMIPMGKSFFSPASIRKSAYDTTMLEATVEHFALLLEMIEVLQLEGSKVGSK